MKGHAVPSVGNEMFLHNMRALWRYDPALALRVDAVCDEDRFPLEPTKSGAWTTQMQTSSGQAMYLHSRYDPAAEANRLLDSVSTEEKFCFVVCGMGLGYHLRALLDRIAGDAIVICTEPSLRLIATALTCVDLADMIASNRLIVLTDHDKARLHERLQPYSTLIMLGARFVQHPPSMRVDEQAQNALTREISEFVTFTRMTLTTLIANARITCQNIAMNLVHYMTTPPIDILRNRFAKNPAVVIAAGPSLSRNIGELAPLKGRAVLCAVQTAIKPLMDHGIVPDFVTTLDFHEMSRKFFENVQGLEAVHMVAEPKATWHVLDPYPGPKSLLDNAWARLLIGEELGARDGLPAGATVAHLAFYLAAYMGCDPIIFVGQDLAFTGHVFYVPGVEIHRAWRSELNRFHTMEQKEWDRIVRNRPILRRVRGVDGEQLYTDELLFTYLEQFEKDIAAVPARVIDATQGGARIRGAQVMTLREACEHFCEKPIDPQRFAYRTATTRRDESRLTATAKQLRTRMAEMDGVHEVCEELLTLLKQLKGLTGDPARFNRGLVRVDELRAKISQETRGYQIVNAATQLAEFKRFSADRKTEALATEGAERAKRQIKRDRDFISAVRDGARDVKAILTDALDRIESAVEPS